MHVTGTVIASDASQRHDCCTHCLISFDHQGFGVPMPGISMLATLQLMQCHTWRVFCESTLTCAVALQTID